MEFPEGFNQLELLESHGHMIPVGTESAWGEEEDSEDEDEGQHSEEWYQQQELRRKDNPVELMLWAAEKNRVNELYLLYNHLSLRYLSIFKDQLFRREELQEQQWKISLSLSCISFLASFLPSLLHFILTSLMPSSITSLLTSFLFSYVIPSFLPHFLDLLKHFIQNLSLKLLVPVRIHPGRNK